MVHFDQNRDVSQKPPQSGQKWANAGSGGIPMLKVVSNFRSVFGDVWTKHCTHDAN